MCPSFHYLVLFSASRLAHSCRVRYRAMLMKKERVLRRAAGRAYVTFFHPWRPCASACHPTAPADDPLVLSVRSDFVRVITKLSLPFGSCQCGFRISIVLPPLRGLTPCRRILPSAPKNKSKKNEKNIKRAKITCVRPRN